MMNKPHRVEMEYILPDRTQVTVIGTVTGGSPGSYSGPPEQCYEAELPDVEIERVFTVDDDGAQYDIVLWRDEIEKIEAALIEEAEQDATEG